MYGDRYCHEDMKDFMKTKDFGQGIWALYGIHNSTD